MRKRLWNTRTAAQAVGVKQATIRQWKRRGQLQAVEMINGGNMFKASDVLKLNARMKAKRLK